MKELDLPLLPAELEELGARLSSRPGSLGLDGAQGLLTACLVGPEPPPRAEEWLMRVLGNDPDAQQVGPPPADLVVLVLRLQREIQRELDRFRYQPVIAEGDAEQPGGPGGWCEGFVSGVDLRAGIWGMRLATDPRLMEILNPIIALSMDEGLWEEFREPGQPPLDRAEVQHCLRILPSAVLDLRQYWRDYPPEDDAGLLRRLSGGSAAEPATPPKRRGGRRVH
ncbi:MAG TPA: YecA family protein [Xanthomonadaceae bacterium]|nr:YecA family protein [Xanthomonadaceae bacterium]